MLIASIITINMGELGGNEQDWLKPTRVHPFFVQSKRGQIWDKYLESL